MARCRHETPQARMIVRERSTSPPSRWTWRVGVDPRDRARDQDLGAEAARLPKRAGRQLFAGHARGEAEVVLDARGRARPGRRARRARHDRAQALRRAVDGGGEAGGAGADDHRVVLGGRGLGGEVQHFGDAAQLRPHDRLAVDDADHGKSCAAGGGPPTSSCRRASPDRATRSGSGCGRGSGAAPRRRRRRGGRRRARAPARAGKRSPASRRSRPCGGPRACRRAPRPRAPRRRACGTRSARA